MEENQKRETKIIRLSIPYWEQKIYPVILCDEKNLILVDCGSIDSLNYLEKEINLQGFSFKDITGIVITHHDFDHLGTVNKLKKLYPHIKIYSSAEEEPYISGKKKSLRLEQAEQMQEFLSSPEEKKMGENFCKMLRKVEPIQVDVIVKGGDFFDWCGKCEIIDTKGHTSGHISLYLPIQKTIITGDAAYYNNGHLEIPNPQYALNLKEAKKSFEKILNLNAETILCYHNL